MGGSTGYVREVWTGLALLTGSVMDVRSKKLPVWFLVLFAAGSVGLAFVQAPEEWQQRVTGLLLGGGLLLAGRLSGCIGAADGVVVMILGFLYGASGCGEQMLYAVFLAALAAIVLILGRRADAKSRLPFLPFLAAGFLIYLLLMRQGI